MIHDGFVFIVVLQCLLLCSCRLNCVVYYIVYYTVMTAWGESQGVPEQSIIKLFGDPFGQVTETLEMQLEHAGPKKKGLVNRCKRFALYIENGVVKIVRVAEAEDDPAGDERPDATLAESMIEAILALRGEKKDEL